jgi:hypothetical protein
VSALREAVLEYARQGLAVFPLLPRDKHPFGPHKCSAPPHEHGFKDATAGLVVIEAWWLEHPDANVGLATGRGVDVLDVDGPEGEATLAALIAKRWPLPETVKVKTARGRHLYFLAAGWPCSASRKLGPKLDTRGRGGYVVLPPSVHPDGAVYSWSGANVCAAAPAWLTQLLLRQEPRRAAPVIRPKNLDRYAAAALEDAEQTVRTAPEFTRNDTLNREAFGIGQLVAAGALPESSAGEILIAAACDAGLPEAEARRTLASAFRASASSPRSGLGSAS